MIKLIVELDAETYEQHTAEKCLLGPVSEVEVRQADGLLSETYRVQLIEPVGTSAAHELGVQLGAGPVIRVHHAEKEEAHG